MTKFEAATTILEWCVCTCLLTNSVLLFVVKLLNCSLYLSPVITACLIKTKRRKENRL